MKFLAECGCLGCGGVGLNVALCGARLVQLLEEIAQAFLFFGLFYIP